MTESATTQSPQTLSFSDIGLISRSSAGCGINGLAGRLANIAHNRPFQAPVSVWLLTAKPLSLAIPDNAQQSWLDELQRATVPREFNSG